MPDFLQHGRRHTGVGTDPVVTDWHYVGASGEAAFQNSWTNSGGTKVPLRWRFLAEQDPDALQPAIEIQGSVSGGTTGTTIFTLPITLDYDLHLAGSDDSGGYVVFSVLQSGDVVYGFV